MSRDNDSWIAELTGAGAEREAAVADLREALVRNLRTALSSRPRVDDAFVEDAVQESLLRILARLDQFQGRSRFVTWATAVAIREAMDELRRKRWNDVSLDAVMAEEGWTPRRAPGAGPTVELDRQAMLDALHEAIDGALTPRQRMALVAEMKGMPQAEIARQMNSNRNAVYKLTHDARKKLRAALEAAGYTAQEVIATTGS